MHPEYKLGLRFFLAASTPPQAFLFKLTRTRDKWHYKHMQYNNNYYKYQLCPALSLNHLACALNGALRNPCPGWLALNLSSQLLSYISWSVLCESFFNETKNPKSKKKPIVTQHVPSPIKGTLLMVSGEKRWENEPSAGSALTPRPTTNPSSYHPHILRIESP